MVHLKIIASFTLIIIFSSNSLKANAVDNAYRLCQIFDKTGLLSKPCEVSGWNRTVDISIDTSSLEAKKICNSVARSMAEYKLHFKGDWKIRIYSPFSNGNTISMCNLPK